MKGIVTEKERQKRRNLPSHFAYGYNGNGWVKMNPGDWNFIWVKHLGHLSLLSQVNKHAVGLEVPTLIWDAVLQAVI